MSSKSKDEYSKPAIIGIGTWLGLWGCVYLGYWGERTAIVATVTLFVGFFCGHWERDIDQPNKGGG